MVATGRNSTLRTSSCNGRRMLPGPRPQVRRITDSYWTAANFGPELEMYATVTIPSGSVVYLLGRIQQEGGANTFDGYNVRVNSGEQGSIGRNTNAASTALVSRQCRISGLGYRRQDWASALRGRAEPLPLAEWRAVRGSSSPPSPTRRIKPQARSASTLACSTSGIDDLFVSTNVAGTFTVAREAWTSRGAGVQTDVTNTVAGFIHHSRSPTRLVERLSSGSPGHSTAFTLGRRSPGQRPGAGKQRRRQRWRALRDRPGRGRRD